MASDRSRWPDVVSTGQGWLDELLLGGLPRRGEVVLWAYDGAGPDAVVASTLNEGLRRGECVVLVTASASVTEVAALLERLGPGFCDHDREGRVLWVDASGRGRSLAAAPISGPGDRVQILQQLRSASEEALRLSPRGFCVGFLGLSASLAAGGEIGGPVFVRNATAILRRFPSLSLFALDGVRPTDPSARTLLECTDGILAFRTEQERTYLRVLRISPVESRDWVECRFVSRAVRYSERTEDAARSLAPAPAASVVPVVPAEFPVPPKSSGGVTAEFEIAFRGPADSGPIDGVAHRPEPRTSDLPQ